MDQENWGITGKIPSILQFDKLNRMSPFELRRMFRSHRNLLLPCNHLPLEAEVGPPVKLKRKTAMTGGIREMMKRGWWLFHATSDHGSAIRTSKRNSCHGQQCDWTKPKQTCNRTTSNRAQSWQPTGKPWMSKATTHPRRHHCPQIKDRKERRRWGLWSHCLFCLGRFLSEWNDPEVSKWQPW